MTATIRPITAPNPALLPGLVRLLTDVVHNGASVGFLAPLTPETAARYWQQVFADLGDGLQLWVAEADGEVVGTVQLAPSQKDNGRHRADVQKMLVRSDYRRRGIAAQLLATAEAHARTLGRTTLVLDTELGSPAEQMYQRLGWQRVGEIPQFAAQIDGRLISTVYFYKLLG